MINFIKENKAIVIVGAILVCAVGALLFNIFSQDSLAEVPPGRIHSAGVFGEDIVAHDSSGGEIVIGNTSIRENGELNIVSDPDEIWATDNHAGNHTLTESARMQRGNIGVLTIPDLNLTVNVYESPDTDHMEAMELGVAHFHHTSAWLGNVGVSAHNINMDGSAGYFLHLYRLQPGAIVRYETALGVREYAVQAIAEVDHYDWRLLDRTEDNRITMVTCITGQPEKRLIVQAVER